MSATALATVTASTKRRPAVVSGLIGEPETNLATLPITPFQSVSAELALEASIRDPREAKVCHCFTDGNGDLYDVLEGDVLVVAAVEYTIRSVAEYTRPDDGSYSRLIVEQRKIT